MDASWTQPRSQLLRGHLQVGPRATKVSQQISSLLELSRHYPRAAMGEMAQAERLLLDLREEGLAPGVRMCVATTWLPHSPRSMVLGRIYAWLHCGICLVCQQTLRLNTRPGTTF